MVTVEESRLQKLPGITYIKLHRSGNHSGRSCRMRTQAGLFLTPFKALSECLAYIEKKQ